MTTIHATKLPKEQQMPDYEAFIKMLNRIHALEQQVKDLYARNSNVIKPKAKKPVTRVGNFLPYVLKVLADGKIHHAVAIYEEVEVMVKQAGLPMPQMASFAQNLYNMAQDGKIKKAATSAFRLIQEQTNAE